MKFTMKKNVIGLLNLMLRFPEEICKLVQGQQPWKAKDEPGARQVIRLQRWMVKEVLVPDPTNADKVLAPESWSGALPSTYVDRLKEIVSHFEPAGLTVWYCDLYFELRDILAGKPPSADLDELVGYVEPETKEDAPKS